MQGKWQIWKWLKRALLGCLLALLLLFGALFLGAAIPVNRDFVAAENGVTVFVWSGPIHTDIFVPVRTKEWDWSRYLDRGQVKKTEESLDYLAFGWGSRTFYLETKSWSDLKAINVGKAFFGLDRSAMHVEWCRPPKADTKFCRAIVLNRSQYQNLCQSLRRSFKEDDAQKPRLIPASAYGDHDAFYEARGRYTAYRTCNTWTGSRLADAGVKVGAWTPTPKSVMWQLR